MKNHINPMKGNLPFQRRLTAYSTLAVAGACALSAAPESANADVIYSGAVNRAVPATATGGFVNLTTFAVGTTYTAVNGGDTTTPVLNLWGTTSSRAWLYPTTSTVNRFVSTGDAPLELSAGSIIGAATTYGTTTEPTAGLTATGGLWTGGTTGYLGFKFLTGTITDYGWALVSVPTGGPTTANPIRVLGLAYENTGASILAGQTSAVPEPGTVGCLAAGVMGAGALAWRRRKVA